MDTVNGNGENITGTGPRIDLRMMSTAEAMAYMKATGEFDHSVAPHALDIESTWEHWDSLQYGFYRGWCAHRSQSGFFVGCAFMIGAGVTVAVCVALIWLATAFA